jgi:U3 small nucleolar ribonucleoprotein component
MEQLIGEYERENLKTRGWALQGEAVAEERGKDELLEQFVDVDYRTVAAPTVTEAKTTQLESIIRKRIKEKV